LFNRRIFIDLEKEDDDFHLRPLGDVHIGNVGYDKEKFEKSINYVVNHKNTWTIGMGDYIDNVMAYAQGGIDKRWNPETTHKDLMTTEKQTAHFVKLWAKVAHKSLGMLAGNHEWKTINQQRFINDFCVPTINDPDDPNYGKQLYKEHYLGRLAQICLTFRYKKKILRDYIGLIMHGGYAGRKPGGMVNRLLDISGAWDFDFCLTGHSHDTLIWDTPKMRYDVKLNKSVESKVQYAVTGTFLKGYEKGVDSYIEINPGFAKRVGTVTITFNAKNGDIHGHT